MPTGQVIINSALTALGILEQGGVPPFSDSNDALGELNAMWQAWGIDEGMIFAETSVSFPFPANARSIVIGPTQLAPYTAFTPNRIYRGTFVTANGRNELEMVNASTYYAHNDLDASAVAPDQFYPEFNVNPASGAVNIFLWPTLRSTGTIEIQTGTVFLTWTLATNYILPQGYQDAIQYALAFRLLPRFGVAVQPEVAQYITSLGLKAEERIRQMNSINRKMPPPGPLPNASAEATK